MVQLWVSPLHAVNRINDHQEQPLITITQTVLIMTTTHIQTDNDYKALAILIMSSTHKQKWRWSNAQTVVNVDSTYCFRRTTLVIVEAIYSAWSSNSFWKQHKPGRCRAALRAWVSGCWRVVCKLHKVKTSVLVRNISQHLMNLLTAVVAVVAMQSISEYCWCAAVTVGTVDAL